MSNSEQVLRQPDAPFVPAEQAEHWYALQTRSRHEKVVAERLRERGFTTFLPLVRETRRWSDRTKVVELPLFAGYVFVKRGTSNEERVRALSANGAVSFAGVGGGTWIPEEQIESVQAVLAQRVAYSLHPFLKTGQRVRVRGGALDGVEGVLVARDRDRALVVSIDAIEKSLVVRVEGYDVEAV
jgi:transcription antitermination factor NusG